MESADLAAAAADLGERARAQRPYLEELLQALVQTESHASQPAGVDAVGALVAEPLERAGFSVERIHKRASHTAPTWLTDVMLPGHDHNDLGDAWILRRDGAGARVLILGDLDTAFLPGSSTSFPYTVDGDVARGPGIADAKGGLVVLAGAIRILEGLDRQLPSMTVVLSPDEQAGSLFSRPIIEAAAAQSSLCLCLECARGGGNLMGARACCGVGRVTIIGREAHAGTDRGAALSAISGFAGVVDAIDGITDATAGRFVTVTQVQGGWRRSVVPGECAFTVDVRVRDSSEWSTTESRIRQVLEEQAGPRGFAVDVNLALHRPSVLRTDRSEPLIATVVAAGRALGLELGVVASNAAGSSAFAGSTPVIDGMGPPGGGLMTAAEHVSLSGLTERASLLALTLISLGTDR
jgi:glutamate carboxypeptidase